MRLIKKIGSEIISNKKQKNYLYYEKGVSVAETLILTGIYIILLIGVLAAMRYFVILFSDIMEMLKFLV